MSKMNTKRYPKEAVYRLASSFFQVMGYSPENIEKASNVLLAAELRGIHSHGLNRIPEYVALWKSGRLNVHAKAEIVHQTPSTALINGQKGLGLIIAGEAMDIAIELAKKSGTGWVAVNNSFHFGIAGFHASKALAEDMVGIATTNANPLVAPTFSRKPMLGTNPIAMVVPAGEEAPFFADFATAPVARGKLDTWALEGKSAPENLVQDASGKVVRNPDILRDGGAIRTLGGDYEHASHKGYCMSAMVDILSAVLPGANFGPFVVPTLSFIPNADAGEDRGIGHFLGAMRIDAFRPAAEFKKDMDQWLKAFRNAPPSEEGTKVLVPGDPERQNEADYSKKGIPVKDSLIQKLQTCAADLGIELSV